MLKLIKEIPFDPPHAWPGMWVWAPGHGAAFEVVQFSLRFSKGDVKPPLKVHVSADNRYKLYLDGNLIGLGPQRGDIRQWYFETYDLTSEIDSGEHVLTAVAWHDRDNAPVAQVSLRPGFLLTAEGENAQQFSTGPRWRCRHWHGSYTFERLEVYSNVGSSLDVSGFTLDDLAPTEDSLAQDFEPVRVLEKAMDYRADGLIMLTPWWLSPRTIPALESKVQSAGTCRQGGFLPEMSIPPNTHCRFLFDHEALTNGYPILRVSGGKDAEIFIAYQEALQSKIGDVTSKGHRDQIEGRMFVGLRDRFRPDGRPNLIFEPFWYRCWRYIELDVQTKHEGLTIHELNCRITGYPLELKAEFQADNYFTRLVLPGFRTMQLCAGETYMDCPYYEQLQYIGDTRIQALLTYVLCGDDRLARQAIDAFDRSRLSNGLTQSNYPAHVSSICPTFSLIYIAMLDDFLWWRGDLEFVRKYMYGVDSILRAFALFSERDGLLGRLPHLSFVDWVVGSVGWKNGTPPGASEGDSYLMSFFYLYAMQKAHNLFVIMGDRTRADEINQQARKLQGVLQERAFQPVKQMFADDPSGKYFSQHTNIMALLTNSHLGLIDGGVLLTKILKEPGLAQTTYYFSHYLFDAMYHVGRGDLIWPALQPWHDMLDLNLTTFAETPEPTRSDCHAWSAHPLYHYFASILGIRPTAPGCSHLSIHPAPRSHFLPGILGGTFMTPYGKCTLQLESAGQEWIIHKQLVQGVTLDGARCERST